MPATAFDSITVRAPKAVPTIRRSTAPIWLALVGTIFLGTAAGSFACVFVSKANGETLDSPQAEESQSCDMAWSFPKFSKSEVDRAGEELAGGVESRKASEIIDNWRAAHSFPLNGFRAELRERAGAVESKCTISQRIKRLPSIVDKLKQSKTRLSQMQDIGGCRAVMPRVAMVNQLATIYRQGNPPISQKDYIQNPKANGYRGIHLIYRYAGSKTEFADLKIEIQLRSVYQHAWATAVETVGFFTQQALKSNQGRVEWRRFFACMGNAIAYREKANPVPNTPSFEQGLRATLLDYVEELDAIAALRSYGQTLQRLPYFREAGDRYFILVLDPFSAELEVLGYKKSQLQKAYDDYSAKERAIKGSGKNAVLVSVEKAEDLVGAYPSYYLDTTLFLDLVEWSIK